MDNRCTGDSCPNVLKTQSADVAKSCTLPQAMPEDVEGCECPFLDKSFRETSLTRVDTGMPSLPGDAPIVY